jgi:hypothetical protein
VLTPDELAAIREWADRATPGPWEPGVAFSEAPVNPGEGGWGDWRVDRDRLEPDLILSVQHLPVGQCYLCEDGPPVDQTERGVRVRIYRRWDSGYGADLVGEGERTVTYHLHRVARDPDHPLSPMSSGTARCAVLDARIEDGTARLVLSVADAAFISRARDAVPALLAEVERLRAEVRMLGRPGQPPREHG